MIDVTFPALPDITGPQAALLLEEPAWRYPSRCGAGQGVARLRLFAAGQATLAVVTETGAGASITNSADEIWQALTARLPELGRAPAGLVAVEHWPIGQSDELRGEHVDQMTAADGTARWRSVWDARRGCPNPVMLGWWMRTGHAVLFADAARARDVRS